MSYYPIQGFYFSVSFDDATTTDNAFQEVSGISTELQTEEIEAGGENNKVYKVPKKVSHPDLSLKRGTMASGSSILKWIEDTLGAGLASPITTKTITVKLLDVTQKDNVLIHWQFENAYPIGWEVGSLNAQSSEILIETLKFTYSKMTRMSSK